MRNTPILLLAYARPENTREQIVKLKALGYLDIYLAIDGPKNNNLNLSRTFDQLLKEFTAPDSQVNLRVLRRRENLGTAVAVLTAVDWFFSQVSDGIIIEDDVYFESDFLNFCEMALEKYSANNEISLISGNCFSSCAPGNVTSSTYPLIWGWASWSTRWTEFRTQIYSRNKYNESIHKSRRCFNYWSVGKRRVLRGQVDSWAILFANKVHMNGELCVLPPVNLVSNIGVDSFATHTLTYSWPLNLQIEKLPAGFKLPEAIHLNNSNTTDEYLEEHLYEISLKHVLLPVVDFVLRKHPKYGNSSTPLKDRLASTTQ